MSEISASDKKRGDTVTVTEPPPSTSSQPNTWTWGRIKSILWDSLDYSPEERKFISKIDFFILYGSSHPYYQLTETHQTFETEHGLDFRTSRRT